MKTIKIKFCDLGKEFDPENNKIIRIIRLKYNVVVTEDADYCIYGPFGQEHHKFPGIRIFYTGENVVPNFNYCDYAISFANLQFGDRHLQYPGAGGISDKLLNRKGSLSDEQLLNRKFCATVISNSKQTDGMREKLLEEISKYKLVDSGGGYKNNVGGKVPDKYEFQKNYKFILAGENCVSTGYTTEKLPEAFDAHAIPIYWGDPEAIRFYNPKSFIDANRMESIPELIQQIKAIDENDELYLQMLNEPVFLGNEIPYNLTKTALLDFLSNIFEQPLEKASRRCFIKAYLDIDYSMLKSRDFKGIIKSRILHYLNIKNWNRK